MAVTEYESGSETVIVLTESTLNSVSPDTADGVFQFVVDTAAMQDGDYLIMQVYEKATAGGTQRRVFAAGAEDAQAEPLWVSPSLILLHGWDFTITQTTGTARTYPWSIRRVN